MALSQMPFKFEATTALASVEPGGFRAVRALLLGTSVALGVVGHFRAGSALINAELNVEQPKHPKPPKEKHSRATETYSNSSRAARRA